jgi:hypothetical protein
MRRQNFARKVLERDLVITNIDLVTALIALRDCADVGFSNNHSLSPILGSEKREKRKKGKADLTLDGGHFLAAAPAGQEKLKRQRSPLRRVLKPVVNTTACGGVPSEDLPIFFEGGNSLYLPMGMRIKQELPFGFIYH